MGSPRAPHRHSRSTWNHARGPAGSGGAHSPSPAQPDRGISGVNSFGLSSNQSNGRVVLGMKSGNTTSEPSPPYPMSRTVRLPNCDPMALEHRSRSRWLSGASTLPPARPHVSSESSLITLATRTLSGTRFQTESACSKPALKPARTANTNAVEGYVSDRRRI